MSLAKGYFVTGTDTEVGKTLVSGALILKLRAEGMNALGFKPVAAGCYQDAQGQRLNEDVETLRLASSLEFGKLELCPYLLDMAVAPHLAAEKIHQRLDLDTIIEAYGRVSRHGDAVIVEGAGGFLIPLNAQEGLDDLAQSLDLPIIIVVGMKLGCINHALLTYEAIQSRHLKIAGWIANTLSTEMPLLKENIQTLSSKMPIPFLGCIPCLPESLKKPDNAPYSIEALSFAAQHLRLPAL
ncbi:MAG: dethiobiotin synthase [Polynucleobacter sp.]